MVSDSLLFIYMEILFKNFTEKSLMVKFVREEKKKSKKRKKSKKLKMQKFWLLERLTSLSLVAWFVL